nr:balbiani ring protein 3-like isoform X1 [Procambarus clarkii]
MARLQMCLVVLWCLSVVQVAPGKKQCLKRPEHKRRLHELKDIMCLTPKDALVPLPVPDGLDWVYPGVWKVKRCSGQLCIKTNEHCAAVAAKNLTIKVEGMKLNNIMEKICTQVTVEEHTECGCMCTKSQSSCRQNEVFSEAMCECLCSPEVKNKCLARMEMFPGTCMWDPRTCTCPCNRVIPCGTGQVWVPEMCSCLNVMEDNGVMMLSARV